jgi:hypothetical protein
MSRGEQAEAESSGFEECFGHNIDYESMRFVCFMT